MAVKRNLLLVNVAVFIILEAASLWMLGNSSAVHKSWLGDASTSLTAFLWQPLDNLGNYLSLKKDNDRLAAENMELCSELLRIKSGEGHERDLWLPSGCNFEYLHCTVISKSDNSQHNYIILDRGWADGVKEGYGVITPKGAIGIIQSTTEHFSRAITFTSSHLSISAKLGLDGFVGNMDWDGKSSNKAIFTGIPLHAQFEVGDSLFTSGHSSVFPADIPLATIEGSRAKAGSSTEIYVTLLEDFSSLRHVIVVKNNDKEELEDLLK